MNVSERMATNLVTLEEEDIPGLITLSAAVEWDYDKYEIQTVISSGRVYGHKNKEGEIVSSAAIIPYGQSLASIGMVIVHPEYRGKGLGRKVTQKCIDSVSADNAIMLIATDEGKLMYKRMGFYPIDYVHKYLCNNYLSIKPNNQLDIEINSMRKVDLPQVVRLDKDAFGEERKTFLIHRIKQAKDSIVVKDSDGTIIGFGLSILGPINLILGPIIAPNHHIASLLIDKLANNHQGKLRIDIPSGNETFMSHLEKCGFVKVSQPPIMIKNAKELPSPNKTLFGIAAQIFG
ncbi:N-acetyltransferase [Virgibacillus pantothenticus]|nr:GNAT family N-acetyltransferase [Virgibacillus pantothenticus]MEB5451466.1 GNAT family N-acetyltransferase [Virgibacillus pantothenticus]MEB5455493.1 GNAT family N-acetyltransferase [Virgibacillus pantothenticus]MEB5459644.1 GNAT family N-acetyltransferase [Virgibacillus pantothenticus]MEB5463799.1 GNAT family N-acetyltransferase [Virgibacillus pantothenticus]MEB5468336.1 GNAT family N-acetyltransferase [Virgibacillus pantothenticus]